jgi:hypothetical protein
MVIVFTELIVRIFLGVEQQLPCEQLESHAGKGPHVSGKVVVGAEQNLRTSVLSCLNLSGEVMMFPAGIAQIRYFNFKPLLQSSFHVIKGYLTFMVPKQFMHSSFDFGLRRFLLL